MKKAVLASLSFALFLGDVAAGHAQSSPITEGVGTPYKDPVQRAAVHYGRGMKAKRKAENAKEPADQMKLYEKAKEELSKAVGYDPNFDATLALGQVYLALGKPESAISSCSRALALKPKNEQAQACVDEAEKVRQAAASASASPS